MAGIVVLDAALIAISYIASPFSGTIVVDGVGVSRRILIYKNEEGSAAVDMYSESDGTFTAYVNGTANDKFRVIIVGQDGEYSKIFRDVVVG